MDVISATGTLICSSTFDIRLAGRSIFDSHAYSPLLGSKCGFRRGFWHGIELPRLKTFRVFGPSSIYFCCLVCCLPLLGFVRCHQRMTAGGHSLPSFHRFGQESVCLSVNAPLGWSPPLAPPSSSLNQTLVCRWRNCLPAHHFPGCAPLNISTRD